jgi:hypothetical protein
MEQGTGNREQGTGNREQGTGIRNPEFDLLAARHPVSGFSVLWLTEQPFLFPLFSSGQYRSTKSGGENG